ncbi:putative acetyltransferase [Rhizobiales bacterium GAS113]|nr:putative acetyltransferase [Rhizobiales bacterium GAS113]
MVLTVREESSRQDEVASLLQQSDANAALLYPNEHRRPLNSEALAAPGIRLFIARTVDLVAAGCCALFDRGDGRAELKRMIVDERFRQQGVGTALLRAVETTAMAAGIHLIHMEVGIKNTCGHAPYRRAGYKERGPFGSYKPSPVGVFFEKSLGQAPAANP